MKAFYIKKLRFITLICLAATCLQCSSDDSLKDFTMTFSPAEPLIVPVNSKIITGTDADGLPVTEDISGPWFKIKYSFKNDTGKCMVILSILGTIYNSVGTEIGEVALDPAELSDTGDPLAVLGSFKESSTTEYVDCDGDGTVSDPEKITTTPLGTYWYIFGFAENADSSFLYRFDLKPQGWFGTENDQQGRLSKTFSIRTQ